MLEPPGKQELNSYLGVSSSMFASLAPAEVLAAKCLLAHSGEGTLAEQCAWMQISTVAGRFQSAQTKGFALQGGEGFGPLMLLIKFISSKDSLKRARGKALSAL